MADLAPVPSPAVGAAVQRHPGRLPVLMAELREELRGVLADLSSHNPTPPPSIRRGGALPGLHWETGVTICPQHYAKPVTVIVLDEEAPGLDLVALQGVDCAFPTDIKTITARDARTLARALLAAADTAERR